MSASIKVVNRSEWPTWLVRWLVRKACADAGVTQYTWTQVRRNRSWFSGRGGRYEGHGGCNRRALKARNATWLFHYFGYKRENSCRDHIPHTSVAVLAKLIRHEVEHAGEGHPRHFRKDDGSMDRWLMEMHCNEMAAKWVNGMTDDLPKIMAEWRALARKDRAANRKPSTDDKRAKRLALRTEQLHEWERRMKLAATKVKKYRAVVRRMERQAAIKAPGATHE